MVPGPILIGLPATGLDDAGRRQLLHPAVGGVVLFKRNFDNRAQLEALVEEIRSLRDPRLLVCIDQEGGRVQRLQDGFTRLPALGALGGLYRSDPVKAVDMAYRHGRVMATEMLACGIDLSFAPVLDLDRGSRVIGDRAFSDNPRTVVELAASYLAGMHDAGMKTTGKHFPGHGSVEADSHFDDVTDSRPLDEMEDSDLLPFRELGPRLDAMMIAHVLYPRVDDQPAGYSRRWLQEILRDRLDFTGVIFSDDLGMQAAHVIGGIEDRARRSLDAGCDLALVCLPPDVDSLFETLREPLRDATAAITSLYGEPTVDRFELGEVAREGIREWAQWQRSLERLGDQRWT